MQVLEIDRVSVCCESFGDPAGRPLLWCHGGLSSRLDATFVDMAAAAAGVHVVSVDRPGTGGSTRWSGYTVAGWTAMAGELMRRLGYERFSVVGWSAGGPYALACGAALVDRVMEVATIAGMYPVTERERLRELGLITDKILFRLAPRLPGLASAFVRASAFVPDSLLRTLVRRSVLPNERSFVGDRSGRDVVAFMREAIRNGPFGVVDDYRALGTSWGFNLSEVGVPVTVWQGARDRLLPPSHAHLLAAALPNARLRIIDGAGHFLPATHPDSLFGLND